MSDQRQSPRKNLMAFTPVYGLQPRTLLGYIEDLTLHGAKVIGERSLESDRQLSLTIEFPGDVEGVSTPRITVQARVAWSKKEKDSHYFDIGFEFTELQPKAATIIAAVLKRYEFRRQAPIADGE